MSEERITRVVSEDRQPIQVKLTKGARGVYRWEISVKGQNLGEVLDLTKRADHHLRQTYSQAQKMKINVSSGSGNPSSDSTHAAMDEKLRRIREAGERLTGGEGENGEDHEN